MARIPDTAAAPPLTYFVDGMDCAHCVAKVEQMVGHLPGTEGVQTSFTRQMLVLHLDESLTSRETLEGNLRALGYKPSLQTAEEQGEAPAVTVQKQETPWYATNAGKLVVFTGSLLALAWALGFLAPTYAGYGFTVAALVGVTPFLRKALVGVRLGDPFSINLLVSVASIGAVFIGEAAEGAVVVFLFAVGELLEGIAAGRARSGIQALAALTPRTALLVTPAGMQEVAADTLRVGQEVQVNPGARVPADGLIVAGTSGLDDSAVTGESMPVLKGVGDSVYAGSINTDGALRVQVQRAAQDNTIARIIHLVEEAEGSRAPTARFINRFSRYYTPGVLLVAILTAALPTLLFSQPWLPWVYKGLALLLIGCPCALVLSVPAAITSGISAGARHGLLIKGGAALETIGSVKTVAFDKTGTLTSGQARVTHVKGLNTTEREVLRLAAAVESGSSHPLARAITQAAPQAGITPPPVTDAQAIPGKAVSAQVEGRTLYVSAPQHTTAALPGDFQAEVESLEEQGHTVVILHDAHTPLGLLALRDEPRPDARQAIAELRRLGVRPVILTGDNARTAAAIARDLNLDVHAELLPEDKLRLISELPAPVAMVGDGLNDAPALARADVGIAMSGGTDVALESADAALLRQRVDSVPELLRLSRATMQNIRQNITFALGLKALFLITTLLGYTNLWMAILADTGATAIVTANALRLLSWPGRRA